MAHGLASLPERSRQADPAAGAAVVGLAATCRPFERPLGHLALAVDLVEPDECRRMHVHVGLLTARPVSPRPCRHAMGRTPSETSSILRMPAARRPSIRVTTSPSDP